MEEERDAELVVEQVVRQNLEDEVSISTGSASASALAIAGDYYGFGQDGSYRPYHDALLRFLRVRSDLDLKSALLDEEAELDREDAAAAAAAATAGTTMQEYQKDEDEESGTISRQRARLAHDAETSEIGLLSALSAAASSRRTLSFDDSVSTTDINNTTTRSSSGSSSGDDQANNARNESNVWLLLRSLRTLGVDGLLYDSSPTHLAGQRTAASQRVYDVAKGGVDSPPAEVVENYLEGSIRGTEEEEQEDDDVVPMIVARRVELLKWAEECMAQRVGAVPTSQIGGSGISAAVSYLGKPLGGASGAAAAASSSFGFGGGAATGAALSSASSSSSPRAVMDDPSDLALLQACLVRLKAGPAQWSAALDLCRSSGQPWRAASLAGGLPYGRITLKASDDAALGEEKKEEGLVEFGNPDRALWKRTAWEMSRALAGSASSASASKATELEGAIYALLADDTETGLANPSLRSWEDGLLIHLRSMVGRYVDEVLAAHNDVRRTVGVRYPYRGTEHGPYEREQLSSTSSIATLHEADIFRALGASPYKQVRDEASHPFRAAIAAFATGSYEASIFVTRTANDASVSSHSMLRFIAHLAIYLDFAVPGFLPSLGDMASDSDDDGLPVREYYLLRYIELLTSDRGLWHLAALYASLLPQPMLVDVFSRFLTCVHDDGFRRRVLRQMRDFFDDGIDLVLLRKTVRMMIFEGGEDRFGYPFLNLIRGGKQKKFGHRAAKLDEMLSPSDICKLHSVRWLCYVPEHAPDALVCANSLLRELILKSKTDVVGDGEETDPALHCARVFLTRFLPSDTVKNALRQAVEGEDAGKEQEGALTVDEVEDASAEYGALEAYVDARVAYDRWRSVITSVSPECATRGASVASGSVEARIANKMERRNFIHQKKRIGLHVSDAANEARAKLMAVLTYEGGWLANPGIVSQESIIDEDEQTTRVQEMAGLRMSCLPCTVFLLHKVLDGTAEWMELFLEDAERAYGEEGESVLSEIFGDRDVAAGPGYWYRSCLGIAKTVASDEFNLQESFNREHMQQFVGLMAEANVNLLRSTQEIPR